MSINPVYIKLAELWSVQKKRKLTTSELDEMSRCLDWNIKHCWNMAKLENESLLAHMTNDYEWQHKICQKIDKLVDHHG